MIIWRVWASLWTRTSECCAGSAFSRASTHVGGRELAGVRILSLKQEKRDNPIKSIFPHFCWTIFHYHASTVSVPEASFSISRGCSVLSRASVERSIDALISSVSREFFDLGFLAFDEFLQLGVSVAQELSGARLLVPVFRLRCQGRRRGPLKFLSGAELMRARWRGLKKCRGYCLNGYSVFRTELGKSGTSLSV